MMEFNYDKYLEEERIQNDPQEVEPILFCDQCGVEIYENEEYYEKYDGLCLCEDCFDEFQELEKQECQKVADKSILEN